MILNRLFELKYLLIEQLQKLEQDKNPLKNEIKSAIENTLFDTLNLSKLITSEQALFDFNVEAKKNLIEFGIEIEQDTYYEKDVHYFHFLFDLVAMEKGLYPAKNKLSYTYMAEKLNEIMNNPEKQDIICTDSTLISFFKDHSRSIDVLNGVEEKVVSKIYNAKIRVVSYNSFLDYVEEKAIELISK